MDIVFRLPVADYACYRQFERDINAVIVLILRQDELAVAVKFRLVFAFVFLFFLFSILHGLCLLGFVKRSNLFG